MQNYELQLLDNGVPTRVLYRTKIELDGGPDAYDDLIDELNLVANPHEPRQKIKQELLDAVIAVSAKRNFPATVVNMIWRASGLLDYNVNVDGDAVAVEVTTGSVAGDVRSVIFRYYKHTKEVTLFLAAMCDRLEPTKS
jgi:hypothetical protein